MTISKRCFHTILLAATLGTGTVRADLIVSAPSLTAAPGSSGNFEILLANTGPRGIGISAFSFDIFTGSPSVSFTAASTMTSVPYIFAGDSFAEINGFPLATKTGQELIASDTPNDGILSAIAPGTTVSLGQVSYSIAASAASGAVTMAFSSPGTSLSDEFGDSLPFTALGGEITITPEPSEIPLIAICLGVFAFAFRRRHAKSQR